MCPRLPKLFTEPAGRGAAGLFICTSLAFVGMYAYYEFVHDSAHVSILVIGVAMGLAGLAEFLPTDRRRLAGLMRVTAIGTLTMLVLLLLLKM